MWPATASRRTYTCYTDARLPPTASVAPLPTITTQIVDATPNVVQPVAPTDRSHACTGTKGLRIGMAVLEATITATGTVENVRVVRSISPDTDAALVACVSEWRYTRATYKGKPVPVELTIAVNLCA